LSGPPGTASERRRGRLGEVALVGIAAVWGLTFVMVQDAIAVIGVTAFLAYRFLSAAVLVAFVFRRRLLRLSRAGWVAGMAMGAALTAGYLFQTLGLDRTTASNAGFITGLFVVATPLLGAVFLGQRAGRAAWSAAAVSAAGLALLSGVGSENLHPAGDGLVLVGALAFAVHILVTDRGVSRHDIGALLAVQLGFCGLFCLVLAAALGELEAPQGATVWSALAVTAVIASALGFFVQSYAQQHASPARTALILASEPAFAGLFGWLLAGDRLTAAGWVGAGLILIAIVAVEALPRLRPTRLLPEG
jgi:drug/metabolite transporter (DMT)-like permease